MSGRLYIQFKGESDTCQTKG